MGVMRVYRAFAPYPHTALSGVDYAQTADVVYTVHIDYPEYKATRSGHTSWTYTPVTYAPTIAAPAAPTGVAASPNTTGIQNTTYRYVITAVSTEGQESRASAPLSLTNDLTLHGNTNTLTLPALSAGIDHYVVYKEQAQSGTFGYMGQAKGTTFTDGTPQIQPILSDTPPVANNPFVGVGMYPSTITFHQQRKFLGRTRDRPNAVWGTQSADFENMDVSSPGKPDDALSFALVGDRVNSVNQMASASSELVVISSNAIFSVSGGSGDGSPLTPSDIQPKRQNSRSGGRLNPITLDDIIFYPANKGTSIRTLGFRYEIEGYQSNNVTIFSPHFFQGYTIVDWAYVEEPYSAIFAVRSDGALLCFTWEAEQQVWGWTLLETDGKVLAVAAITEGGYDRLYAVIERTINGVVRRFHERLALPHVDDIAVAAHLDCSVTQIYDPARNVISGLSHLEGATVSAYYDGYVAEGLVVANGSVTLPNGYEATIATVGLPYQGEIETLPMTLQTREGSLHSHIQNIGRVVVRAVDTRGLLVGITGTELEAIVEREGGEDGLSDVAHRDYEVSVPGHWEEGVTLTIRQEQPLPAHITGIFIEPKISKK